jgi:cell division protein FtsQ
MPRLATTDPQQARRWKLVRARPANRRRRALPRRTYGLIGLAGLLVAGLGWVVFGTSTLGVRVIEVTGAAIAGDDQVRAVAAVPLGTPLARVDTGEIEDRVRALVSVAEVDVSRSWPRTLSIEVTERSAVASVVAPGGGFLLIDGTGVVFHTVAERPAGVALLRLAAPGPQDPSTLSGLRVLAALTEPLRSQLAALVAESPTRIRLELVNGTVVVWGDAESSEAKAAVATALLARKAKTIDVSSPDVATTS